MQCIPRSFQASTRQLLAATVGVAAGVAVLVRTGVRVGVLVGVGEALGENVGPAVSARPLRATEWSGLLSALLVIDILDLNDPLAGGEKRTVTDRVSPGVNENGPAPEEIENGESGEATLPEIDPFSARSVKESSRTSPLKRSDRELRIKRDGGTRGSDRLEAPIVLATIASSIPRQMRNLDECLNGHQVEEERPRYFRRDAKDAVEANN